MRTRPKTRLSPQDLEEWRISLGAPSQKELAKWLGINARTYRYWLNRDHPIPRWLEIIIYQQNQILDLQTLIEQLKPRGVSKSPET